MTEAATTALICPKCAGAMRTYERNGITIDQCTECRGIFLDRGELERLVEAEDVHYGGPGAGDPPRGRDSGGDPRSDPSYGYDPRNDPRNDPRGGQGGGHGGRGGQYGQRKRKGGFLGDLLDFG